MDSQRTPKIRIRWPVQVLALVPPLLLAIALATAYDSVPDPMPVHWGADGVADSWAARSLPLLMAVALGTPVIAVLGLGVAAGVAASLGGGVPLGESERSRNDALNTWAHAESAQAPLAWASVALSVALTAVFTGLTGPWGWSGRACVVLGGVGAVATLVALAVITGQAGRRIDLRYPSPSGQRTRWLVFVDAPGAGIIAQNNRGKYTLNTATTAGRLLAVALVVVAVVVALDRVGGVLVPAV
jgi:uncharacterized membrane protein